MLWYSIYFICQAKFIFYNFILLTLQFLDNDYQRIYEYLHNE